jgi:hypothetical protein
LPLHLITKSGKNKKSLSLFRYTVKNKSVLQKLSHI